MARSPGTTRKLNRLAGSALAGMISLVRRTSRVVYEPADALQRLAADHPLIVATWHGQFMMTSGFRPSPETKVAAMVARHGDAELIGAAMAKFGVELIRGAGAGGRKKDRGGAYALRQAVRYLKDGYSLVMTADVPPGPARRAGIGIVMIARMSGRPIVPCAAATSRFRALNTWSRMTINLPGSKLAYVAGDPIWVSADAGEAELEFARAAGGASAQRGHRPRLRARRRRREARHAAEPAGCERPARRSGFPPQGLPCQHEPAAPHRAAHPQDPRAQWQGGSASPRRAAWPRDDGASQRRAVLGACRQCRRDQRRAAGHRSARQRARPISNFLLTTGTVTSAGLAERRLGPRALHQYVPLDAPEYAARFLEHWRPDLAVFTESEVWPSLILETAARNIPIALVNARLSHKSRRRWQRNKSTAVPLFGRFSIILAQNDRLALGFSSLGARNVLSVGNLKIDAPPPPVDLNELERLKAALGNRPVFAAASTHEGEEETIAAAHRALSRRFENLCTIIAPRHPERGTALSEMLKDLGFTVAQRSLGAVPGPRTDIYIADTIGELGTLYALSPVAFIGGSLIDRGGQNPIEAVRHGVAVLTGPHWQNFRDAYRTLLRHDGAIEVKSAADIAAAVAKLLDGPAELQRMRSGATQALTTLSGALDKTVEALLRYIPDESLKRAS